MYIIFRIEPNSKAANIKELKLDFSEFLHQIVLKEKTVSKVLDTFEIAMSNIWGDAIKK